MCASFFYLVHHCGLSVHEKDLVLCLVLDVTMQKFLGSPPSLRAKATPLKLTPMGFKQFAPWL